MNCASCHNPSFGWEAPLSGAVGAQKIVLDRSAPTILNEAWGGPHFFWDGRAKIRSSSRPRDRSRIPRR